MILNKHFYKSRSFRDKTPVLLNHAIGKWLLDNPEVHIVSTNMWFETADNTHCAIIIYE